MALRLKTCIIILFFFFFSMNQIKLSEQKMSTSVLSCLERILTCQYYMHYLNPPSSCCSHLKQMIAYNPTCICSVFQDDVILNALNTTRPKAANLMANCGIKPNFEICDDSSASSITLAENFRSAKVFFLASISLLLVIGIM